MYLSFQFNYANNASKKLFIQIPITLLKYNLLNYENQEIVHLLKNETFQEI